MPETKSRTVYHTYVKYLAYENLLSAEILRRIPKSTLSRWINENPKRYEAFDLNLHASADYGVIQHFSHNKTAKRVYSAYVRVIKFVLSIVHTLPGFHRALKRQNMQIVELVKRVRKLIGLQRTLCIFNISVQTFRNWSAQNITQCFESLNSTCNRVFHNQLSKPEVTKIREMLTDSQFQHWPISSVAFYALRKNILPLSLNTWYKYVSKLSLVRPKSVERRKKTCISVRAQHPHQIWHADITVFATSNHVRHYLYLVVDNFSRKIITWLIADSVNAEYRKATLVEAVKTVKHVLPEITLITDGGPENKLQKFLDSIDQPFSHKVALVDVHYSNSLIEAHNKVIKYNYLYRMDIADEQQLRKIFPTIVNDFNSRPHVSLNGLTPNEAEQNILLNKEQLSLNVKNATQERLEYNTNHRCPQCRF